MFDDVDELCFVFFQIVCVVSSVLLLTNGACRNAPSLIPSAAFVALSCGVIIVMFYGVIVLGLSLYLPQVCLLAVSIYPIYTDDNYLQVR